MYSFKELLPLTKGMEFPLGFDKKGNFRKEDLSELNHLLISGGSGFGKSNLIDSLVMSLIAHNGPEKVRFVMCDTKESEFSRYANIEHLLMPVATTQREISVSLGLVLSQGQDRLKKFGENGVKTISSFNDIAWENFDRELPRIVVVVDDLAAVINPPGSTGNAHSYMSERIEEILSIGRAAGIHFIAATQTPAKKKMRNISSQFLSKLLFYLPSRADMRFLAGERAQGIKSEPGEALFCNGEESEIIHTLLLKPGDFGEIDADSETDLIDKAAEIAVDERAINETTLQGSLGVSGKCASKILFQLEEIGLVGSPNSYGNREVLVSREQWDEAMRQIENE